jgi:hypothetical protein
VFWGTGLLEESNLNSKRAQGKAPIIQDWCTFCDLITFTLVFHQDIIHPPDMTSMV